MVYNLNTVYKCFQLLVTDINAVVSYLVSANIYADSKERQIRL